VNSPLIADVCCNAGQAADGYAAVLGASSIHVGVDIEPQPDYPYPFLQAHALDWLASDEPEQVDALHNAEPCQLFTTAGHLRSAQGGVSKYPDLLTPALALVRERWAHKLWVFENVDDNRKRVRRIMAPRDGEHLIMLCGSMFGLQVQRHRLFLANFPLRVPEPTGERTVEQRAGCRHDTFPLDPISGKPRPWGVYHVSGDSVPSGGRTARDVEHGREVMGSRRLLPWGKLKEGHPPAYTSWVAADLLRAHLSRQGVGD
jgi:DNA (cytosine-5)-methyltransferase 1